MNDVTLSITLSPSGNFYFDIILASGNGIGEIIYESHIEPEELPAVALTMMEIQLQEGDA